MSDPLFNIIYIMRIFVEMALGQTELLAASYESLHIILGAIFWLAD